MSEMITIKAELLKWCPWGFSFIQIEYKAEREFQCMSADGDYAYDLNSRLYDLCEEVQVNAKAYETACIERIKEMFDDCVCSVVKRSGQAYVNTDDYDSNTLHIPINCDPRPHEDNYTIEVV